MSARARLRRPFFMLNMATQARLLAAAFLGMLSCAGPAAGAQLDGVWQSIGYGVVIDMKGEHADVYDLNAVACLKREGDHRVDADLFREPRLSEDRSVLTTLSAIGLTIIRYRRLPGLPAACTSTLARAANDPLYNFDAFWSWFDEHYAFFERRGIDWQRVRDDYRPRITSTTTPAELRELLSEILRQFQDAHVSLSGDGFRVNSGMAPTFGRWFDDYLKVAAADRPSFSAYAKSRVRDYLRPSWQHYLDPGSLREVSLNVVTGTAARGRIGYVMVAAESGYSPIYKLKEDQAAARTQLDQVFAGFSGRDALILDMRINFGGHDDIALALAGLLTTMDRPGFAKCSRDGTGFTQLQRTTIRRGAHPFAGPVVILSSPYNVSAGENFMMMAKDLPNVLIVGDRTSGVHSDTLDKALPNGWEISVSNEAFIAPDGSMYETVGVPPHVLVPYYPEDVRTSGVDPLMEKALHLLSSPNFPAFARAARRAQARGAVAPCPDFATTTEVSK